MENRDHNSWYNRMFSALYDPVMSALEAGALRRRRHRLLKGLTGEILELGCGTGGNFEFYGKQARILALEPSDAMRRRAQERLASNDSPARIRLEAWLLDDALAQGQVRAASMDAAVCTLVLCTVPDPRATLAALATALKPGGRLVALEHVRARHSGGVWLQEAVNPLWRHLAEGCHLTRDTHQAILNAGFIAEHFEEFEYGLPFVAGIYTRNGYSD